MIHSFDQQIVFSARYQKYYGDAGEEKFYFLYPS